ncbi:MAG TPA: hypothetical protein PKD26_09460 [Pyrinomonadaceae bacterium]|nr:hypothetical protein [Pyrinomonadaceae bacterium]
MSDSRKLADRIAKLLDAEQAGGELASVFASIEKINHRLDKLEAAANPRAAYKDPISIHPSMEKFAVVEAVADKVVDSLKGEKACAFEPNGKPCDHCSMCSSRGF